MRRLKPVESAMQVCVREKLVSRRPSSVSIFVLQVSYTKNKEHLLLTRAYTLRWLFRYLCIDFKYYCALILSTNQFYSFNF